MFNKKIISSPEIKYVDRNINYERLTLNIKSYVESFADVLTSNYNDNLLNKFYYNINKLKVVSKDSNLATKRCLEGRYSSSQNKIIIYNNNIDITIFHELFHMSTRIFKNGVLFTGFHQRSFIPGYDDIGYGINEGYTELLTERYFANDSDRLGYYFERFFASYIEKLIGEDKMSELYFKADILGLIDALKAYNNEETIIFIIKCLDYFSANWQNKMCYKNNDAAITYCQFFIYDSYLKLLKNNYDNNLIDKDTLIYEISELYEDLCFEIVGYKAFELNFEEFLEDVTNIFGDVFKNDIKKF